MGAGTFRRVLLRRQDGQTVPLLMMIMLSLLAIGVLFFQVARAAIFSTEAQTAADAAALGAVQDIKAQLTAQVSSTGTSALAALDSTRIRAAAERYARENGGHVIELERRGVDVKVWTETLEQLGHDARKVDAEQKRGVARARARIDVLAIAQPVAGGGNIGSNGGGGIKRIKSSEWKDLADEISKPPTCGDSAKSNDLVTLGKLLEEHGFAVGENAEMGDNPADGIHASGGFHYKCRRSGALDVNADNGPGTEKQIIDGIVGEVQKLGFRTIWQAAGHFDHIHIDVANSGPIGLGGDDGGAVGALEETGLDVKLIDWDATYEPFSGGFGGLYAGGTYGGPPNMKIAAIICDVLDKYADRGAGPRVRLSAFEAAIVESGVHNLTYGDRDSLGVFQQRWSVLAWGTAEQIMDPVHATEAYVRAAIARQDDSDMIGKSAGALAQGVQNSGFPLRYDQVQLQALALMEKACG
jgi:hypothetical protein